MTPLDSSTIAHRVVNWCELHQRSLPWRSTRAGQRDPYQVWISEIMAQQTRVDVVSAYYLRWIERFPTVQALAAADLHDVLKLWEGFGYYARARNLHLAARRIVAEYGGVIPSERKALLDLPGIGPYTAGALLSFSFGRAEPVLDGNVTRVLSRLADIADVIDAPAIQRLLWKLASELVLAAPAGDAGVFNEGLMELGATLCSPTAPSCLLCPLRDLCAAANAGVQGQRPVKSPTKRMPHYDVAAGVIWQAVPFASRLLIAQRPHKGLLGGLWEFPGGKLEAQDADLAACLRREIAEELAIDITVGEQVTTVRHAYTHFRITLHAFHARHLSGEPQALGCDDWRWVEFAELAHYPFPVTDQKIIRALEETGDDR
jgi:A/G-specific adenine glycosylase